MNFNINILILILRHVCIVVKTSHSSSISETFYYYAFTIIIYSHELNTYCNFLTSFIIIYSSSKTSHTSVSEI